MKRSPEQPAIAAGEPAFIRRLPEGVEYGVAMEVYEERQDLEPVRELLGHARIDTTQVYARIRPPQLKRAVEFYEERATRMLSD
jgi:site-specific recombinase XerC